MKKIYYESPTVEVVDVRVEKGFIVSGEATAESYMFDDLGDMDEVQSY